MRTSAFFISYTLTVILTAVIVPQKQKIQTELFALKVRLAPECYLLPLANKKEFNHIRTGKGNETIRSNHGSSRDNFNGK